MTENGSNVTTLLDEVTSALDEFVKQEGPVEPPVVIALDDTHYQIAGVEYVLITNYRDAFTVESLSNRYQDVLEKYDYIVGDWGYEQLRLKGFYHNTNRKAPLEKRIQSLEDYLYEYCNFGCAYFVLKREGDVIPKVSKVPREQRRPRKNRRKNKSDKEQIVFNQNTTVSVKSSSSKQAKATFKQSFKTSDKPKNQSKASTGAKQRKFAMKEVKANADSSEVASVRRKTIPKSSKRKFEIRENGK